MEQGWNKSGHIHGDALKQFWGSGRATRPDYGTTMALLGPFGVLLGPPNGTPDPRNGSNASLGMCPDLFHLYSTLFRQSGATTPPYGYKMTILGHLGPFWSPFGAPIAPLTRETVPLHCPGCALTCSTFTLHCSASLEPPDPLMAPKLPFLAVWGPFRVL